MKTENLIIPCIIGVSVLCGIQLRRLCEKKEFVTQVEVRTQVITQAMILPESMVFKQACAKCGLAILKGAEHDCPRVSTWDVVHRYYHTGCIPPFDIQREDTDFLPDLERYFIQGKKWADGQYDWKEVDKNGKPK